MTAYEPRPGSVAARAVDHLRAVGGELATAVIADALDVGPTSFPSCVEYAVRHGALARTKRGNILWWRVGDGKPLERENDEQPNAPDTRKRPPLAKGPAIDQVLHGKTNGNGVDAAPAAETKPRKGLAPHGCIEEAETATKFACALYSDGRLLFEFDGFPILTLSADQTRILCRHLDRLAPEAA